MHSHQRRRARGVDRNRRAAQVEEVREPVGDDAQRTTGVAPRVDLGAGRLRRQISVLADACSGEHAGLRAAQRIGRNAGVLQAPPTPLPAAAAAAGPSWPLRGRRSRRTPRRRRRRRRGTSPTGWCRPRRRPTSGEPSSNGCQRSGGHLADRTIGPRTGTARTRRARMMLAGEPAAQADDGDRLVDRAPVGGVAAASSAAPIRRRGQELDQRVDRRVLPEVHRRHRPAQQLGQFPGQHDRVARATPRSFSDASRSISSGLQPML